MSFKQECKSLMKGITKIREDADKQMKDLFYGQVKKLFELHPVIKKISWTQYTPGFCDGDPCTFGSNHEYASVNGQGGDDDDDDDLYDDDGNPKKKKGQDEKALQSATEDVHEFLSLFSDDDMEQLFGDPARVIITKKGIKTEDYDCGY